MGAKGLLIDITRCIGCGACHDACSEEHGNPATPAETWNHESWVTVRDMGNDVYLRRQCMHCEDPACASVCPVAALHKTEDGPVAYRAERCMGCRYCMVACPFGVPKYEWDERLPLVRKCVLCEERLAEGRPTACSEACPAEATTFGEREELLREAQARLEADPELYEARIFGVEEVGGTSVLYLAPKGFPFEEFGNLAGTGEGPLPELTYKVLSKIPTFAQVTGTALIGLYWIINRRMTLAHEDVGGKRAAAGKSEQAASHDAREGRS